MWAGEVHQRADRTSREPPRHQQGLYGFHEPGVTKHLSAGEAGTGRTITALMAVRIAVGAQGSRNRERRRTVASSDKSLLRFPPFPVISHYFPVKKLASPTEPVS